MAIWKVASLVGLFVILASSVVYGFVISATGDLDGELPFAFRSDLSGCESELARVAEVEPADAEQFSRRLEGAWKLKTLTVSGKPTRPERTARLYFDFGAKEATQYAGAALRIEGEISYAPAVSEATTFWEVVVRQPASRNVALDMTGQALFGDSLVRQRNLKSRGFTQLAGAFAAQPVEDGPKGRWDKVVLTKTSLTYVSCEDQVVERYVKTTDQRPLVAGMEIRELWEKLHRDRVVRDLAKGSSLATPHNDF
jgi:hypothetical protein